jgi:AraC family chitin signaling transcriptional activator
MQLHFKLLFISVLCINSTLYTQTLPPIQSFPMEEYAAGNQNWMVAQGSDREIYVANNEGVLVFDAYRWKLYPTNSIVRSVVVLDGILYSGSYMDFGYWEKNTNGELSYHSLVEKHQFPIIEDEQFWNIYLLDDTLIFQSLNRLILLNRETSEIKSITPDLPITKSFVIDNRLFFQLESDGVYELDGNGITYLFGKSEFKNTEVIQLFPLSDGFRVLTSTKGLFSYRNNRLLKWNILQDDFLKDLVYSGLQSANGDYVIGTVSNGLYIISENGRKSKHYNFEKGLLNNTVLSIYEDADLNLWLGLDSGLNCVNINSPYEAFIDAKGQLGTVYSSIRFNNRLYVASNRGLFYRSLNNPEANFKPINGLLGQNWNLEVVDGVLFCGHDMGTFVVQVDRAIRIGSYIGAWTHKRVNRNTIIVGAYDGVHVLKRINGVWKYGFKVSGFDISSRHLELIQDREVLISHEYKGVYRLQLSSDLSSVDKISELSVKRGRHSSLSKFNDAVYYLSPDGFFEYDVDSKEFLPVAVSSEMFQNDSYLSGKMILDAQNRIWTFFEKNIAILQKNIFDASFSIQKVPIHSDFRKANLGFENVGTLSSTSYLLGTMNGFLILDLNKYEVPMSSLHFNQITASNVTQDFVKLPLQSSSVLDPDMNNLRFDFSVPFYSKLNNIQFQWYLEGYQSDWVPWSNNSFVEFKNLDYGNYTFHIRAQSGQQLIGEPLKHSFTISFPWYLSYWAMIGYLLFLVFVSLFINNLYTNYYRKQQTKYVEEANRELAIKELASKKELVEFKNEQLNQSIENKNRELAISTMSMIKKNSLLGSIKAELQSLSNLSGLSSVIRIIDHNINNDDDWNFFEVAFNNADQDFLKKIKEIHPNLTPNDLRLCAYLRLNLSSKEIASLLNITSKSVEIKRYRLRKRMNLEHGTNLISYILSV